MKPTKEQVEAAANVISLKHYGIGLRLLDHGTKMYAVKVARAAIAAYLRAGAGKKAKGKR